MKKISEPIVFFGSGPVAAESLRLIAQDFTIEVVVTKPRAPHHTGEVPVLTIAQDLGLQVQTASNKVELDQLFAKKSFVSKAGVLIDFGIIVSQKVIDYFPYGIINSHFSILPEWRGADPITFAVLCGQKTTGVSLMFLVEKMDEGPLLSYAQLPLDGSITTPELTQKLIHLSDSLLKRDVPGVLSGQNTSGSPQSITGRKVSYSRKLTKQDGSIDWSKPAEVIEREIRAFTGWPKSRTNFDNLEAVITKAHVLPDMGKPGHREIVNRLPAVHWGAGTLVIDSLKPAGKQEMTGEAFLAGYKKQLLG